MARAFLSYESNDTDLSWLVEEFLMTNPNYQPIETGCSVLMLVPYNDEVAAAAEFEMEDATSPA